MITENGISGTPPELELLNFNALRERGLKYIQELSGDVWTDFNLHDPGLTLLEILCYAITDSGYKTERIKEAFLSDAAIAESYIEKYLFSPKEMLPSLPVTLNDIENHIEQMHQNVIAAWVAPFPIMHMEETIRGGYEVSVFLADQPGFDNLNSDVVEIRNEEKKTRIQFMLFDDENRRFPWNTIDKIRGCELADSGDDAFFQFEKFNGQLRLRLDAKSKERTTYETFQVKARIAVTGIDAPLPRNTSIAQYKEFLLTIVATDDFLRALHQSLQKEQYKDSVLEQIRKSLLPVRSLCEDFIRFKVVNVQEIKMNVQLLLKEQAPSNEIVTQRLFERMDDFMLSLVRSHRKSANKEERKVLYASHIIEELGMIEGVKAVQIENLNLFVDGIPTISLQEEGSFDCLNLQSFARYAPKVSREKSEITLIRHGVHHTFRLSQVSASFTPKSLGNFFPESKKEETSVHKELGEAFFESIRKYVSIQDEFPQNYRLKSGQVLEHAPQHIKDQQKRFKSYLLFFDRLLLEYTERLFQFSSQLGVKQDESRDTKSIDSLVQEELPDVRALHLISNRENTPVDLPSDQLSQYLLQKNQVLDHLLARFGIAYEHLESKSGTTSSRHVIAKMRLLRAIPIVTKERGLGLPLTNQITKDVWKDTMLSGLQKRLYRLLGVNEVVLQHKKLSATTGKMGQGFYVIEHFLLTHREENHVYEKKLNHASHLLIDYLKELNSDRQDAFNYSFEITLLIPNWYREWSINKKGYEEIIRKEVPAHILPHIHWVNRKSLQGFEILYEDWLKALYQTYN